MVVMVMQMKLMNDVEDDDVLMNDKHESVIR
jgi:hypothetical protein